MMSSGASRHTLWGKRLNSWGKHVSASQKLKWRKLVNQLRYMYEEFDIVQEMSSTAAKEFQEYYEEFCRRHDVDIAELNRQNAERIQEIYGTKEKAVQSHIPYR
jgi:hypothetical protein